jgi:hypothetical protein
LLRRERILIIARMTLSAGMMEAAGVRHAAGHFHFVSSISRLLRWYRDAT